MRLVVWVVWGVFALQAGALRAQAELRSAVAAVEAMGVRAGVVVADADGQTVYRHRSKEAFRPASNLKLITAASLLAGLGG
ncbi:MAG: D-alanyl-D-alanine carboxypeptidase, partial [Planctomycetota bacterium]|nr:D-alanyl-D-alanine carboxypeptidase [Planctomycetota bacterium]